MISDDKVLDMENLDFLNVDQLSDEQIDNLIKEIRKNKISFHPMYSTVMKLSDKKKELFIALLEIDPGLDEYFIVNGESVALQIKNEILQATFKRNIFTDIEVNFLKRVDSYNFIVALLNINFDKAIEILNSETIHMHKNEYSQIYQLLKEKIDINKFINAPSIRCNPYFVIDYLKNGGDSNNIDAKSIDFYEDFFEEIEDICNKRNIDVPIRADKTYKYNSIDDLKNVINDIKDKNNIIIFELAYDSRNEFSISKEIDYLKKLKDDGYRIFFQYKDDERHNSKPISLSKVIESENFIDMIINDIKSRNLSPLEQYILVFQLVRNFKDYKKEKDKKALSESRQLYRILNNDYIVCAGYTNLLVDLCERLGIPAKYEKLQSSTELHARPYVHIKDEKYDIDGYYVAEPTWADRGSFGDMSKPIMTTSEAANNEVSSRFDYVLQIKTVGEFEDLSSDEREKIIVYIKELDPIFYKQIVDLDFSKVENQQILINYLSEKIDKPISRNDIAKAMTEAQCSIYRERIDDLSKKSIYIKFLSNLGVSAMEIASDSEFLEYLEKRREDYSEMTLEEIEKVEPMSDLVIGYYVSAIAISSRKTISKEEFLKLKEAFPTIDNDPSIELKNYDDKVVISMKRIKKEKNMKFRELLSKVELNKMLFDEIISKLSNDKVNDKVTTTSI